MSSAHYPAPPLRHLKIIVMIIPILIVLSSGVIIYNNYLYNTLSLKCPVSLITFHLGLLYDTFFPQLFGSL
jgi:hypothetical protein